MIKSDYAFVLPEWKSWDYTRARDVASKFNTSPNRSPSKIGFSGNWWTIPCYFKIPSGTTVTIHIKESRQNQS